MIVYCYSKWSTCKKALKYLEENNVKFNLIDLVKNTPTAEELKEIIKKGNYDIDKYFNTRGKVYKELNLKEKLSSMTDDEKVNLLSTDGLLIKRPLLVDNGNVILGFKEDDYKKLI